MGKSLHVLIVEDSPDDAELLVLNLERGGLRIEWERVDTADKMQQAIDKKQWNIVIADYVMPRFNGLDALKLTRQKYPDLPFIIVSGTIGEEVAVEAMKTGAQDYIMKDNMTRLVPAVKRELKEAASRHEKREADKKIKHLNQVLLAVRDVNQLITREKNREQLIQKACNILISTRGYNSAWIALFDENKNIIVTAQAGIGDKFKLLQQQMKNGIFNKCSKRVLAQSAVALIKAPHKECEDCPLINTEPDSQAMTIRLESEKKIYGLLSVCIPAGLVQHDEEKELFKEVAEDLAFALHNIGVEEKQRKAEQDLKKSEENFRFIADNSIDTIWQLDKKLKFTYLSPSLYQVSGYKPEEWIGTGLWEHAPRSEFFKMARLAIKMIKQYQTFKYVSFETQMYDKKGELMPLEILAKPMIKNGKLIGLQGSTRDITERKKAEHSLKASFQTIQQREKEVSALLEASRGVIESETFEQAARSVFDECRKAIGAQSGYVALLRDNEKSNDLLFFESGGMSGEIDPKLLIPVRGLRAETYKKGKAIFDNDFMNSELGKLIPKGHLVLNNVLFAPLNIEKKTVGIIGLANKPTDFTADDARLAEAFGDIAATALERTRAKEALQESEEKYRMIVENAHDGIEITQNDKIIFFNNQFAEMLGYSKEELKNVEFSSIFTKQAIDELHERYQKRGKDNKKLPPYYETTFQKKDGTSINVGIKYEIINYKGKPATFAIIRDITEQKKAQRQIQRDLEIKETLLKEIHHRVKNNLQVVVSLLNLQSRKLHSKESIRALQVAVRRIYSMALIHEKLYQSKDYSRINFSEYIKNLCSELMYAFSDKRAKIDINLNIEDIVLGIDSAIPCGLLLNEILTNAIKHAFPENNGGRIDVTFKQNDDQSYQLTVKDNGVGISEDVNLEKTDSLGMHLIGSLASQINGNVNIEQNNGTIITINFKGYESGEN